MDGLTAEQLREINQLKVQFIVNKVLAAMPKLLEHGFTFDSVELFPPDAGELETSSIKFNLLVRDKEGRKAIGLSENLHASWTLATDL